MDSLLGRSRTLSAFLDLVISGGPKMWLNSFKLELVSNDAFQIVGVRVDVIHPNEPVRTVPAQAQWDQDSHVCNLREMDLSNFRVMRNPLNKFMIENIAGAAYENTDYWQIQKWDSRVTHLLCSD